MRSIFTRCGTLLLGMTLAVCAQAGVVLNTTRVIYTAQDKEVSLGIQNSGTGEILAQSWLETDAEGPDTSNLPFVLTPALARMSGNARQLVRIIYAGSGLPQHRESVFWLNVQEIPQTADENVLQIAVRQRIKVFFRPHGLQGNPLEAAEKLEWRLIDGAILEVSNPTPYHVSMIQIGLTRDTASLLLESSRMLAPLQRVRFPLEQSVGKGPAALSFISINDFGAQVPFRAALSGDRTSLPAKVVVKSD
ncbi:fimbrial biogenesis chaperone [Pseudomonas huanghezhanensis]|uniref:fimbrial biogenesis chaperone n=1 Tax=Pseudomonas huanghezhanensis TaxID=3002903 RepID=UPI00228583EB|nr:molecular chaperone [Pseudomonas sp. BSw22131]